MQSEIEEYEYSTPYITPFFTVFGGCFWRLFLDGCFWMAVFGWLFLVALTGHQTHVGRVFLVHMQPVDVYFARPTGLFGVRIDFVHGGPSNDVPAKRVALVVVSRDPHPRHCRSKHRINTT